MIVMGLQLPAANTYKYTGKIAPFLTGPIITKVVVSGGLSVVANSFLIPLETLKIRYVEKVGMLRASW